ncbi:MAG: hypothetical protein ACE5EV_05165 [Gaiellales bacterium]
MEEERSIDRPMRLAEVLAVSIRAYGDRPWRYFLLGLLWATSLGVTRWMPFAADAVVVAAGFLAGFSLATLFVTGRRRPTFARAPWISLIPLLLVVGAPAAWAALGPVVAVIVSFWLAVAGFALPIVLLERPPEASESGAGYVVRRCATLARANYLHSLLTVLVLFLVLHLLGVLLAGALAAFADSGRVAAELIAHAVFMPLVFIGLVVLYGDQSARARGAEPGVEVGA